MDPLARPEYLLLLLEQGERSLEGHTRLFLVLASLTSYPDNALCVFYDAILKTACRAPSSEDGPRANFAAFVEWTLARNGSPFPICSQENLSSSTLDPVPSPPSPRCAECTPEPTATDELSPRRATELRIAAEPELCLPSDQMREPATMPARIRESMPRSVRSRRGALPTATWLRVSCQWIWVKRKQKETK